jgi:hypothetical protein
MTERCAAAEKAVQMVREHFATYLRELKRLGFTPGDLLNLQTALPASSTSSLFTILTVGAELPTVPLDESGLFATVPVRVSGNAAAGSMGRLIVADKCVQAGGPGDSLASMASVPPTLPPPAHSHNHALLVTPSPARPVLRPRVGSALGYAAVQLCSLGVQCDDTPGLPILDYRKCARCGSNDSLSPGKCTFHPNLIVPPGMCTYGPA